MENRVTGAQGKAGILKSEEKSQEGGHRERKSFKREQTIAPTREGERRGRGLDNSAHLLMKKETRKKIARETRGRSESYAA
jgi:hypothetical protein